LAVKRALLYLLKRDRTVLEISHYLKKGGFSEDSVQRAIVRLIELGYLNDSRVALSAARAKLEHSLWAPRRVEIYLRQRGVSEEDVRAAMALAMEGMGEERLARKALNKYLRSRPGPWDKRKRRGAFAYLSRRGFSWDIISRVMGGLHEGDTEGN
jgi:regulatory protein